MKALLTPQKTSRYILALGLVCCLSGIARADTLIYSTPSGTTPITDGNGTVSSSTTIFYDSTTSTASVAPGTVNILQFGDNGANSETGTVGTITVSGTVQADGLSFEGITAGGTTGYTLGASTSAGTIALQGSTPTISLTAAGVINSVLTTATGSNLTITGYNSASSSVNLTVNSTSDSLGGNLTLGSSTGTSSTQNTLVNVNYGETGTNFFSSGTTAVTVYNGDTLRFDGTLSVPTTIATTLVGAGAGGRGALSLYGGAVAANLQGAITLAGNTTINNRDETTISGNIGQSATSALTISQDAFSTDAILFSGNNTFSGGLILNSFVNNASVKAGSSTAFGSGLLTLDTYGANLGAPYSSSTDLVDLNGQTVTVGGISGGANTVAGTTTAPDDTRVIANSASGTTATLNLTNTANNTYYGEIMDNSETVAVSGTNTPVYTAVAGGKTAVTQSGTGKTTLAGHNIFTGDLTISAGTVALTSTATLPSARIVDNATFDVSSFGTTGFSLGSTQVLAGSGSVTGQINLVGGSKITPGSLTAAGKLTLAGGLDYTAAGAQISFRLNTTSTSDELLVTGGNYTQSTGTVINLANGGSFAGTGTYSLIDVSALGAGDMTLADYSLGTTIAGYTETLQVNGADDILQVQVTAAPEPSPLALLGGGLLLLGVVLHRRFKFVV